MLFSDSHEWIFVTENIGKVGISHHALNELGQIVYVELPKVGQEVKVGEQVCVLESTKAAVDVYSPVSGKIVSVQEPLHRDPTLLNKDPEALGWIFEIQLADPLELNRLMTPNAYRSLVSS